MPDNQSQHTTEMGGQQSEAKDREQFGHSWREQSGHYMHEGAEYLRQGYGGVSTTMSAHPMTAVLVGFGLGVGVGLLLGTTLGGATRQRHWYDFDWDIDTESVERFGRKVLDALADALPDSVSRRLVG